MGWIWMKDEEYDYLRTNAICWWQIRISLQVYNMLSSDSSELLLQRQNLHKHRVDKNRLLFASILNVFTFLCAIFSMAYYQWISITFAPTPPSPSPSPSAPITIELWTNLLYAFSPDQGYVSYTRMQALLCTPSDTFCLAILYELDFVGQLCFGVFAFAFLLSGYDFCRVIKFAVGEITTKSRFMESAAAVNYKNNFRSVLMVVTYGIGLSLNYFAMNLIQLQTYVYGVSFWLFLSSLVVFVGVAVWENRKMSRISQQELVIKLLEREKRMLMEGSERGSVASQQESAIFTL